MIHAQPASISSVTRISFTDPQKSAGFDTGGLSWSRQCLVSHTSPESTFVHTACHWLYGESREALLLPHELAAEQAAAKVNESTVVAGGCE